MKWLWILLLVASCSSTPVIEYQTVPAAMIPPRPALLPIKSKELQCLSDETYMRLVVNLREMSLYADELRALLIDGGH